MKKCERESNYNNKGKTLEEVIRQGLTQRRNIPKEDMERGKYIYKINK